VAPAAADDPGGGPGRTAPAATTWSSTPGDPLRTRRRSALLLASTLTALTLVPVAPAFATEAAAPPTVTATVDDVPVAPDAAAEAAVAQTDLAGAAAPAASSPVETDVAFSIIGLRLPEGIEEVAVRTRDLDGAWGEWLTLDRVDADLDGPDLDAPEAADAADDLTEPAWVGPSDAFQLALDSADCGGCAGGLEAVEAELIDTLGLNEGVVARAVRLLTPRAVAPPAAEASAGRPTIVSRAGWGADERITTHRPSYRTPTFAVLHHTAGSNTYTKAQAAGVVRGIHTYHARTLGWGDIGYNVLVDRYGTIYEGRAGGLDRGVIGAHARGYNTGSFGVSVMGNFDVADIPAVALESVARVTAWKYDVHGIDRSPTRRMTVNGTTIDTLTSHRNVGQTACPGRYLYAKMGQLRTRVAALATGRAPTGTTASASRFSDVPAHHTHHDAVEALAVRRITEGCAAGRFCPGDHVVRAQMASFLVRALGLPPATGTPFRDVTGGPHAASIATLAGARITTGCARDRFCPDDAVTRAQMATFIARGFEVPRAPEPFRDVLQISEHASAIGGLVEAGIANGYGDRVFRPDQPVTRAEMAAFLSRALEWRAARGGA
jgi:hypothetical protein